MQFNRNVGTTLIANILIGLPASCKSTFCSEYLSDNNVVISLDILKSRVREKKRVEECISQHWPFVVDNTNITKSDRLRYIDAAKCNNYLVHGYYFSSTLKDALRRNRLRVGAGKIPDAAIFAIAKRLELPAMAEGFDQLFSVQLDGMGGFIVKKMI